MKLIKLGVDRFGKAVHFPESYSYNVIVVIAKPRYGKTILVKNIYSQIARDRPVIIFDYQGEHSESKWGNWLSKDKIAFIPDLHTISDFGFYLSDFDQMSDWMSMGFSAKNAPQVMKLLKFDNIHHDNPLEFLALLSDLPTSDDEVPEFNKRYERYGLTFATRVHNSTKQSIVNMMSIVWDSGLIIPPVGSKDHAAYCPNKVHIDDWGAFIHTYKHLNINLNIVTSNSVPLARASVGKILDRILPTLHSMRGVRPLIVVEEADYICPNVPDMDTITSLMQLRSYVLKHQRTGVELMFISQDPNLLDQYTLMGGTIWIMGQHMKSVVTAAMLNEPDMDYHKDIIHKLQFDRWQGVREFALMHSGEGGKFRIFQVDDSCTRDPLKHKW